MGRIFSKSGILYLNHNLRKFVKWQHLSYVILDFTKSFFPTTDTQTKTREYKDLEIHFTAHLSYYLGWGLESRNPKNH